MSFEHAQRRLRWWAVVVVLAILGSGAAFAARRSAAKRQGAQKPAGPPPPAVTTTTALQGDIGVHLDALGTVTPLATVTVKTRVDGELIAVNYREGQMVRQGDVLAEIDPRPFQAQLLQAEGQYQRDLALLKGARVNLTRYRNLYGRDAIQKQTLDDQAATVQQYEGAVKFDRGQVESAKVQLAYCRIVSPVSGRVGLRLVDPGNVVQTTNTTGLVVITQLQPIAVVFPVAEDSLPQIQAQMQAGNELPVVALDRAQQKQIATGKVLTFDNQIDPTTGTVKLKAIFPNQDGGLFPNQFVNARLLVDVHRGATLVPAAAIQRNAQGAYVYRVNADQTVALQSVSVGATDGDSTEIVKGLQPGNAVATDNFDKLQDGIRITPQRTATAAAGRSGG